MPALEVCCRTWEFGSDDLFFPGVASVTLRAIWLVGALGGALYFRQALLCESTHYLAAFTLSLLIVTLLGVLVELAITVASARGTIVHVRPRRFVAALIYARIAILVLDVVLLVVGTIFVVMVGRNVVIMENEAEANCPDLKTAVIMMAVVIGLYWFAFFLFLLAGAVYMDPCHCYSARVNYHEVTTRMQEGTVDQEVVARQWKLVHSQWEKRFRVLCCAAGSDDVHQLAYKEVAEIFAHLFCDTNVVMSDIVAGFGALAEGALDAGARGEEQLAAGGQSSREGRKW